MATSGTTTYTLNRDEVIRSAYELIGIAVEGEDLETEEVTIANRALNVMVKAWQSHGLQLWKRGYISVTLVEGQVSYTLGPTGDEVVDRPLRIISASRKETATGTTTSLTRLALEDYDELPNPTTKGTVTQYYFEPTLINSTLKVWLAPDATMASDYTVELIVQSPIEDLTSSTDDFDFPQEWLEAIIYGLAVRLAPRYSSITPEERMILKNEARTILDLALSFDTEDGSIYFQPDLTHR